MMGQFTDDAHSRPTIVSGLGYTGESAQLHTGGLKSAHSTTAHLDSRSTVPPYVPSAILTVVVSILSDKLRWRGPLMLILLPVAAVGEYTECMVCLSTHEVVSGYIIAITAHVRSMVIAARHRSRLIVTY